jgi:hypothetical protein
MSQAASQWHAFVKEVAVSGRVSTVRDAGGYPQPQRPDGRRVQPFWSSFARAQRVIKSMSAFEGMEPAELSIDEFVQRWLPGLERDGVLVGVNWTGSRATGYDIEPAEVGEQLERAIAELEGPAS